MDDYVAVREAATAVPEAPAAAPEPLAQEFAESAPAAEAPQPNEPGAAPQPDANERRGVQKRFDELTRRAMEAERRADLLLETQRAMLAREQPKPPEPPQEAQPPREEDYPGDYRAFLRAEAEFTARKATGDLLRSDREARDEQQRQRYEQAQSQQHMRQVGAVLGSFQDRADAFAKEAPDYDQAVQGLADVEIGPHNAAMVQTLLLRPDSAKVLYHLGKNPGIADQISRLPPALQGSAVGEFAASLRHAPQPSNAPPPGRPVGSRSAGSSAAPAGSMDDYAAWRQRQG